MIDSNTVAEHLVRALLADGVTLSDADRAQGTIATLLAPLVSHAATLAQVEIPANVPLDSELRIEVDLTPEQTAAMAEMYDARAAAGAPIPGPRPGPLNQPSHDLSNEDITLATIHGLARALTALGDGRPEDEA